MLRPEHNKVKILQDSPYLLLKHLPLKEVADAMAAPNSKGEEKREEAG